MKIITDEQYETITRQITSVLQGKQPCAPELFLEMSRAIHDYDDYKAALQELNDLMSIRPADHARIDELSDFIEVYECDKITTPEQYQTALDRIDVLMDEFDARGSRSIQQYNELVLLSWAVEAYEETITDWEPDPFYWRLYQLHRLYDRFVYWLRRAVARVRDWIARSIE